jgi:hypothetical protein
MKILTTSDSSILAYIAAAHDIPKEEMERLYSRLSEDAREIASAVVELKLHKGSSGRVRRGSSEPARKTAKALLAWA